MTYNIQNSFELEGYFAIKVTPLGANLCLLEEFEDGEIRNLIEEGKSWWSQWFSYIREWKEDEVDNQRVAWLRFHGIPCHAWNFNFFEKLANQVGTYICADENTQKGTIMDVARIMVRTDKSKELNDSFSVSIDGL